MSNLDAEMAELELELEVMIESDSEIGVVGKVCKHCGEDDQSKLLRKRDPRTKEVKISSVCTKCSLQVSYIWMHQNPERVKAKIRREKDKLKRQRRDKNFVAKFIFLDSRSGDSKANRENDLTKEFISDAISNGCQYCGTFEVRMTLDRIDNSKGHLKSNVVPSCTDCNYIRKDVPYEAWLHIAPKVREARELGLFGSWEWSSRKKKV